MHVDENAPVSPISKRLLTAKKSKGKFKLNTLGYNNSLILFIPLYVAPEPTKKAAKQSTDSEGIFKSCHYSVYNILINYYI
jgi:hypothetical protein